MMQVATKRLPLLHHSFMQHSRCGKGSVPSESSRVKAVFVLAVAAHLKQHERSQAVPSELVQVTALSPLMHALSAFQARNRRLAADVQRMQRQLESNGAAMTQMQDSIAAHEKFLESKDALIQHLEDDIFRSAAKSCNFQSAQCVLQ